MEYLKVEMNNVIISNLSLGGGTGDIGTETITLSYGRVKYTYVSGEAGGGKGGRPVGHARPGAADGAIGPGATAAAPPRRGVKVVRARA